MGDCLKQARSFMLSCDQALASMNDTCPISKTTALATIQSAAKTNRARAIYRAAQDALTAIDNSNGFAHQINRLAKVLSQYDAGVTELEGFETSSDTQKKTDDVPAEQINESVGSDNFMSYEQRQERALTALNDSLSYATSSERPALSRLISLAKGESHSKAEAIQTKNNTRISLETIMPDIIHQSLRSARQTDLTLSVSYDVNTASLTGLALSELKSRLKNWINQLIKHIATETDKQSLVHIDITAQKNCVVLSTKATALPENNLASALDKRLVSQTYDAANGQVELTFHFTDRTQKAFNKARPVPIEFGVTERLEALMATEADESLTAMSDIPLAAS